MVSANHEPIYESAPPRYKMQGDPWTRKKTMMALAIGDLALALFLICYAGYRLLRYDYKDQSLMVLISSHEFIVFSVLYWLIVFAILSLQLVIAFLLLSATNDMTIDPDTMIKKCEWWRTTSFIFFVLLILDIFILTYESVRSDRVKIFRMILSCMELAFRIYGIYFVGKFIRDLHTLFAAPMVHYANPAGESLPNSPICAPRCPVTSQRGVV